MTKKDINSCLKGLPDDIDIILQVKYSKHIHFIGPLLKARITKTNPPKLVLISAKKGLPI